MAYNGILLGEVSAKTAKQMNKISQKRGFIGKFISKGKKNGKSNDHNGNLRCFFFFFFFVFLAMWSSEYHISVFKAPINL